MLLEFKNKIISRRSSGPSRTRDVVELQQDVSHLQYVTAVLYNHGTTKGKGHLCPPVS